MRARMVVILLAWSALMWSALAWPAAVQAQTDDKTYLTRLLQDSLSGAGRVVEIEGFRGALSSRASLTSLTIADDQGIWLTLRGVTLDWNRAALLQRRLDITALSADEIVMNRLPAAGQAAPSPQARAFALPVLPVSIAIGSLSARRVDLGADVLGTAAALSVQGSMQLSQGEGAAQLTVARIDGVEGRLTFAGSYANASRQLTLALSLTEAQGGIAAALLNLPGDPALGLSLQGAGPIDDYTATIGLQSDGQNRLAGTVRTSLEERDGERANRLRLAVAGDIAPLFSSDYRDFFGPAVSLTADALRFPSGRMDLTAFDLKADQVALSGRIALGADGLPQSADITGRIAAADGSRVLLPLPGDRAQVASADLWARFDAAVSDQWTGSAALAGLQTTFMAANRLELTGTGRIARTRASNTEASNTGATNTGATRTADATLAFTAQGVLPVDTALAAAVGPDLSGRGTLQWADGADLILQSFVLNGADYAMTLSGSLGSLERGLPFAGQAAASLDSAARLSGLAGRSLTGAVLAEVTGSYGLLSGAADVQAQIKGRDLALDQPQLDRLLAGTSSITLSAARDQTGTTVRSLTLAVANLTAAAKGTLRPDAIDLTADLDFASLAILGPGFSGRVQASGALTGTLAQPAFGLTGTGDDLAFGVPVLDGLIAGPSRLTVAGSATPAGIRLDRLTLAVGALSVQASGTVPVGADPAFHAQVTLSDLSRLGAGYSGSLATEADVTLGAARQSLALTGTGTGLQTGVARLDQLLAGQAGLTIMATRVGDAITIQDAALTTAQGQARASGTVIDGKAALAADVRLPDLAAFGPPFGGSLSANARIDGTLQAADLTIAGTTAGLKTGQVLLDKALNAPAQVQVSAGLRQGGITLTLARLTSPSLQAEASGALAPGATRLQLRATLPTLGTLGPGWRGRVLATGSYVEAGSARTVTATATGTGLGLGQPQADRVLQGTTTLDLAATMNSGSLTISRLSLRNPVLGADVTGRAGAAGSSLALTARLADMGLIAPGFSGALTATGSLDDTGGSYGLNLTMAGPGALAARITGTVARTLATANLTIAGQAQAAMLNGILAPRSVEGPVTFALTMNGPLRLASLAGTVRTTGARLATGLSGLSLGGISATATLAGGQARITAEGTGTAGGRVSVAGSAALAPPHVGDLSVTLQALALRDPDLFETTLTGGLTVRGPVTGGGRIAGTLDLGQTELRVPSSGLGGAASIPNLIHRDEPAAVLETRRRAGLIRDAANGSLAPAKGTPFALDITLNAPRRVFIRGRGLDAELGGALRLTGTTSAIVPQGDLNLIRGRLDLLGKRFTLDEGLARLQGRFLPFIRLVASTASGGITSSIIIEGDASSPTITFASVPDLPEEEVLARLLFGRALSAISPLQAAQLAGAVASLAGRGGDGLVARLRRGFGLDDLDVQTDGTGNAALRAGKYLSDNVYTDVTIGADGKSAVSLNLDLSPSLTLRGKAGSDGNTGIGLFFEKDY